MQEPEPAPSEKKLDWRRAHPQPSSIAANWSGSHGRREMPLLGDCWGIAGGLLGGSAVESVGHPCLVRRLQPGCGKLRRRHRLRLRIACQLIQCRVQPAVGRCGFGSRHLPGLEPCPPRSPVGPCPAQSMVRFFSFFLFWPSSSTTPRSCSAPAGPGATAGFAAGSAARSDGNGLASRREPLPQSGTPERSDLRSHQRNRRDCPQFAQERARFASVLRLVDRPRGG